MKVGLFDNQFNINLKQEKEYKKLFDFKDFDFEKNWPFSYKHTPDEEIYVLCTRFLFKYIMDKSKNRTDENEIRAWVLTRDTKTFKKIQKKQKQIRLNDILLLLGNNSSSIMIRKRIPEIKTGTVFGTFDELIKLNRILFDKANKIINTPKNLCTCA